MDLAELPPTDLRRIFQEVLAEHDDYNQRRNAAISGWNSRGYVVITGGQQSDGSGVVRNYMTDALLFHGSEEEHDRFLAEHGKNMVHIDHIDKQVEEAGEDRDVVVEGVPRDLVTVLQDWIWSNDVQARQMVKDWTAS